MNLQEKFNQACGAVAFILNQREELIKVVAKANQNLEQNSRQLQNATGVRNELHTMMGVVPADSTAETNAKRVKNVHLMEDRQSVFAKFREIPDTWIAPQGLAILSSVEEDVTAAILRRASKLDGVPVEHNGKRGRASMYRWTSQ